MMRETHAIDVRHDPTIEGLPHDVAGSPHRRRAARRFVMAQAAQSAGHDVEGRPMSIFEWAGGASAPPRNASADRSQHAPVPRRSRRQPVAAEGIAGRPCHLEGRDHDPRRPARSRGSLHHRRDPPRCRRKSAYAPPLMANTAAPCWRSDFVAGLDGVELYVPEQKVQFKGGATIGHSLRVNGRIGLHRSIMLDDYRFVASHVHGTMPRSKPSPPPRSCISVAAAMRSIRRRIPLRWTASSPISARPTIKRSHPFGAAGCKY